MNVRLSELLEPVLAGEPPLADEVDAVFRRADRLHRRRTRMLLASGAVAVAAVVAAGFVLTSALLPRREPADRVAPSMAAPPIITASAPTPSPSPTRDSVRAVVGPAVGERGMHVLAGELGDGWREYPVRDADGIRRGIVRVAIYRVEGDLCFPVLAAPSRCARAERTSSGIDYVRYDDEHDPDRQVHQTIAHRDGRALAVMAAGERDIGAKRGKPALTGKQVERVATDERLFDAFAAEHCGDGCPDFAVPVP
ncbi:hypothetical protein HH310_17415 [Actinoplanes sp. TBRC 11911]|uniref:hypothetical protein n=1 Tax=Actinoplanes sp. TBRC 11911 TaxID=2729386 RepID=UPI00145E2B17|nr:hypothetical protein [Actinoplanes sp. TBRC 11911]NMO52965.1 hypothetical protein [Actinoplanes sp. TBRC 11911]